MENASPSPSRRHLIAWGGATAVGGLAAYLGWPADSPPSSTAPGVTPAKVAAEKQQPAEVPPVPAGPFNRDLFVPHLNSEFTLKANASASATCKLVEVSPASVMKTPKGTFVAFSIVFESHPDFLKDGSICEVTHPGLQPMQLFVSPVGKAKKDKTLLEAAFTLRA